MIRKINPIAAILLLIPVLSIVWSLILNHLSGPHFLSRSDPEYVYLLNGMNAALLKFDRIGHVDHPGTPFQMITGLFILVIYWVSGSGTLIHDVLSNPEKYLFFSSFFLTLITAGLIFWISRLEYKRSGSLTGALIIPVSLLCYTVIVDLPSRYIPDRLLMILLLFFSGLCILYFSLGYPLKKFAAFSGILMALGVVTKINFLPFLILPLFFIQGLRGKITYGLSMALSVVILILPIHDKIDDFWRFAVQISTHEGLYGGGNEQVLNPQFFGRNLLLILKENPAFVFVLLLVTGSVVNFLFYPAIRKQHRSEFGFLLGFLVVAVLSTLIVAKHYKNYYMIPILSISGLAFYVVWMISNTFRLRRMIRFVLIPAGLVFIFLAGTSLVPGYQKRMDQRKQEQRTHAFIQQNIPASDYFFIEPTWMAGPMVVNGLVYGISYIGHRHYYYNDYERLYPHILTYEGMDKSLKYFRTLDADNESIFKSGKDIYLLGTPGRNSGQMYHYLDSSALSYDIHLTRDTIYRNEVLNNQIVRIGNSDGWMVIQQAAFGFEEVRNKALFSDDGIVQLTGPFSLTDKPVTNGLSALELGNEWNQSPVYQLKDVRRGDFVEVTIKRRRTGAGSTDMLVAKYTGSEGEARVVTNGEKVSAIHPRWELVRLTLTLSDQPADSTLLCYYEVEGKGPRVADDFVIRHYSKRRQEGNGKDL